SNALPLAARELLHAPASASKRFDSSTCERVRDCIAIGRSRAAPTAQVREAAESNVLVHSEWERQLLALSDDRDSLCQLCSALLRHRSIVDTHRSPSNLNA